MTLEEVKLIETSKYFYFSVSKTELDRINNIEQYTIIEEDTSVFLTLWLWNGWFQIIESIETIIHCYRDLFEWENIKDSLNNIFK